MTKNKRVGFTLSSQIAVALALGISFGLFLGELAGFLSQVADGYIGSGSSVLGSSRSPSAVCASCSRLF